MLLHFDHETLILDASCIICLYASGRMEEILALVPKPVAVADYVYEQEALWIYGGSDPVGKPIREPVVLQPFVDEGLLRIVTIETEAEAETLVSLAVHSRGGRGRQGQGELVTGAIAVNRNWAIVCDDRRARRLFEEVSGHLQLIYTLELVRNWVDHSQPPVESVTELLQAIRGRASYTPQRQNPQFEWWHQHHGG